MAWIQIGSQKLRYFRKNKSTICSEKYCTLKRNVTPQAEAGKVHGKRVVLPHTHTASPRWFKRKITQLWQFLEKQGRLTYLLL